MNISKTKVMMENYHKNPVREYWKLHIPGTEIQHQRQIPRQGDSKKNHGHSPSTASNIGTCLKRQVYNSYVLPAMSYLTMLCERSSDCLCSDMFVDNENINIMTIHF